MKEIINTELIEQYLQGQLNDVDSAAFEQQIDADPNLKNEVDFQRDMISSLENARDSDLKLRMAAIAVGAGFGAVQKFAITASTLVVGSMIFFGISEFNSTTESELIESQGKIETVDIVVSNESEEETVGSINSDVIIEEELAPVEVASDVNISKPLIPTVVVENRISNDSQVFDTPSIPMDDDEVVVDDINEEPKGANSTTTKSLLEKYDVNKHPAKKKGQYAYEYDKENLDLYGDFTGKEYYLYELKGTGKIYLLFDAKYYEISETKSRTILMEIQDLSTIESLKSQK